MLFNKESNKKAQQEMVGFVLIVVIVLVGMIVFLVFNFTNDSISENDIANNILSSVMKTTSSCALVYEPNYEDMRDLFRSCYDSNNGGRSVCANTNEDICETLESTLSDMFSEILVLEPIISAYELDFLHTDSVGTQAIFRISDGNLSCPGTVYGSEPHSIRISSDQNLLVLLKICVSADL